MIVFFILYLLGFIAFLIHAILTSKPERTKGRLIELFLLYQLVFSVGITSFISFIALTFFQDIVAQNTEWPSCPYQYELANVNLAYGFLGFLCIWFRRLFWYAVVIGFTIWIFSDAIHHYLDALINHHYSAGNVGLLPLTDWLIPLILCISLYFYYRYTYKPELY